MLIPFTVVEALLPALSVQVPVTDCPAPSVLSVVELGEELTPESASVHVKLTVTGPLFQTKALGSGLAEPEMTGGVLSILMPLIVKDAEFPARSVTVPVTA